MSRYIEFNDAVKVMACEMYAEAQSQGYDVDGVEDFIPEATAWMNDAPSIDIMRCKECRKSHIDGKTTHYLWCTEWGRSTDTFGYCERGEREGE